MPRYLALKFLSVALVLWSLRILLLQGWIIFFNTPQSSPAPDAETILVNTTLLSSTAVLCLGLLPLTLGLGIWQLAPWARVFSVCLFTSQLFPRLAAALGLLADPGIKPLTNLAIAAASALALWILLSPGAITAFSVNLEPKSENDMEN